MTQKEKDRQDTKTIPQNSGFGVLDSKHGILDVRLKRGSRSVRLLLLKGTAVFLLLVFATTFLHGNWPVALVWVSGGAGLWMIVEERKRRHERTEILSAVEMMDEERFRNYAADLLRTQGYAVLKIAEPGSRFSDFLLTRGKENCICRLQRQSQRIGRQVVSTVLSRTEAHGYERAMILTNQQFTFPARRLARRSGCVLIDRTNLASLVVQHRQGHRVLPFHREETARLRRRK